MKNALTISTLISILCAVQMAFGQATPSPYTDAEAYAVYSVVMEADWPIRNAKAKKLVIQIENTGYPYLGDGQTNCLKPAKGDEAIYGPVITAFSELNKKALLLQPKFKVSVPYQLVTRASIDEIFKKGIDGWTDFYAKYPDSGGVISMSAVGFNSDKMIAIVYVGHSCGGLCGGGGYHVLQKIGGTWSEIEWKGTSCFWAS